MTNRDTDTEHPSALHAITLIYSDGTHASDEICLADMIDPADETTRKSTLGTWEGPFDDSRLFGTRVLAVVLDRSAVLREKVEHAGDPHQIFVTLA